MMIRTVVAVLVVVVLLAVVLPGFAPWMHSPQSLLVLVALLVIAVLVTKASDG